MSTDSLLKKANHSSPDSDNFSSEGIDNLIKELQKIADTKLNKTKSKIETLKAQKAQLRKSIAKRDKIIKELRAKYEPDQANNPICSESSTIIASPSSSSSKQDMFNAVTFSGEKGKKSSPKDKTLRKNEYSSSDDEDDENVNFIKENLKKFQMKRSTMNKVDLTKSQYISYLENFSDVKCQEVELLLNRLLKLVKHRNERIKSQQEIFALKRRCMKLEKENDRLRQNFAEARLLIEKFIITHRENKAERRSRELNELAKIRAENEKKNLDLYSYITTQLRQFMDFEFLTLDEKAVRLVVSKAAAQLKVQRNLEQSRESYQSRTLSPIHVDSSSTTSTYDPSQKLETDSESREISITKSTNVINSTNITHSTTSKGNPTELNSSNNTSSKGNRNPNEFNSSVSINSTPSKDNKDQNDINSLSSINNNQNDNSSNNVNPSSILINNPSSLNSTQDLNE